MVPCSPTAQVTPDEVNTHGFCVLPDELLLEIISCFQAPSTPSARRPPSFPGGGHLERRNALIALSLTCRNLRRVFRPSIWERIVVYSGMRVDDRFLTWRDKLRKKVEKKRYYTELLRQLNVVTTLEPTLAESVRIVDIEITDFNLVEVFFRLGQSFSLFPNLHTVMIAQHVGRGYGITPADQMRVQNAFRKHRYPQIQSAVLSAIAYPLLGVCPNLRSFEACVGFNLDYLLKFLNLKNTASIQRFSSGHRISVVRALEVAKAIPSLQEITIYIVHYELNNYAVNDTLARIKTLIRSLKNLQVLTIESDDTVPLQTKDIILKIPRQDFRGLKKVVIRSTFMVPYHNFVPVEICL